MRVKITKIAVLILVATLVSTSAFAFKIITTAGKEVRWKNTQVKYKINRAGSDDFSGGFDGHGQKVSEYEAIHRAFDAWENVAGVELEAIFDGYTSKTKTGMDDENTIIWVESGWGNLEFRPPAGALAVTISSYNLSNGEMVDADIHFNGDGFRWAVVDSDEEGLFMDLQSIATHEIGHFFGLDHPSEDSLEQNLEYREATMYYAAVPGE